MNVAFRANHSESAAMCRRLPWHESIFAPRTADQKKWTALWAIEVAGITMTVGRQKIV